jgi:hypothetical protein
MASSTSRRCIEPSATDVITAASETAFTKNIAFGGYELGAHSLVRFGGTVKHPTTDGTETQRIRVYLGTSPTAATGCLLADTGAVDCANDEVSGFSGWFEIKVHGGASVAQLCSFGTAVAKSGGTISTITFDTTEAQLDTTAPLYLIVTCVHSDAAGNVSRLDSLWVDVAKLEAA